MQINYRALIKQHGRRGMYHAGQLFCGEKEEVFLLLLVICCVQKELEYSMI